MFGGCESGHGKAQGEWPHAQRQQRAPDEKQLKKELGDVEGCQGEPLTLCNVLLSKLHVQN